MENKMILSHVVVFTNYICGSRKENDVRISQLTFVCWRVTIVIMFPKKDCHFAG